MLLASVNSQLGGTGHPIAVEYAFYLFFALSLLCIVAVLLVEQFRVAKHNAAAVKTERWTRVAFLAVAAITVAGGVKLVYSTG